MSSTEMQVGPLACRVRTPDHPPAAVLVLLHGYAMDTLDLEPLAAAMGVPAMLYLPRGPIKLPQGRSWWPVDIVRRSWQLAQGPRDLYLEHPPGREEARTLVRDLVASLRARHPGLPLVVAGFSQGGMLACDTALFEDVAPDGLALLSASRIAWDEWQPRMQRLHNVPVLVAHGRQDKDLAFQAGEHLRDALEGGGACVTWHAFEGQHEIPLTVWRQLRRMILTLAAPPQGQ
jgi:phospholipase/carboxylesterase